MRKGSATTMGSLILIFLLIGMVALYANTVNDMIEKEKEVSLKKTEVLKTKNTFYLMNRSLEITWFVSSIQNIFDAGETSLGVPYWYEIDMHGSIANLYRPSRAEGREDLVEYLNENMEEYTDSVAGDVTLPDSVLISISGIESEFGYLEQQLGTGCCAFSDGSCTGIITQYQCGLADGSWTQGYQCCPDGQCLATCTSETDTITAEISQNLEVSYVDTVSRAVSTTTLGIPTVFLDMIQAGSVFVTTMIIFAGNPPSYAYTHTNKEAYYLAVEENLRTIATPSLETVSPDSINIRELGLEESLAFVPNPGISEYNAVDIVPSQAGLVLHSIAYCIIEEDNEGYYYHDEAASEFIKQPFFLDVKSETYLGALDCSLNNLNFFGYDKPMDTVCFNNLLYTCGTRIPGEELSQVWPFENCLTTEIECDLTTRVFAYCRMKLCQQDSCSGPLGLTYTSAVCCDEFCSDDRGCDCSCTDAPSPYTIDCNGGDPCYDYYCNACYSNVPSGSKVDSCGCSPCSARYRCGSQCCTDGTCYDCLTTTTTVPPPVCPDGCWVSGTQCCCYDPIMGEICF